MLYLAFLEMDRSKDLEFFAVFWQGSKPPPDFKLHAAYNLLTDLRVIVFEAESIASLRWLDKLNNVGKIKYFPAQDQTDGYHSVINRDLDHFARFSQTRRASEENITRQVDYRRRAMEAPSIWAALQVAAEERERLRNLGGSGE